MVSPFLEEQRWSPPVCPASKRRTRSVCKLVELPMCQSSELQDRFSYLFRRNKTEENLEVVDPRDGNDRFQVGLIAAQYVGMNSIE